MKVSVNESKRGIMAHCTLGPKFSLFYAMIGLVLSALWGSL